MDNSIRNLMILFNKWIVRKLNLKYYHTVFMNYRKQMITINKVIVLLVFFHLFVIGLILKRFIISRNRLFQSVLMKKMNNYH